MKEEMFIVLDVAERLGGISSPIFYKANKFYHEGNNYIYNEKSAQEYFIEMLENETNRNYKDKIILKSIDDGYCSNCSVEKLVEGEE